jgi:3-oxoacyl-[acyl-carrier-protein] synthase III
VVRTAQIVSTASYLPEHAVTNAELTARFTALGRPTVIDRLGASTGITRRFYAPDDWVTSDLALAAARKALDRAARKPREIDLIILGTTSPDYVTPDTSVVVQHKLAREECRHFRRRLRLRLVSFADRHRGRTHCHQFGVKNNTPNRCRYDS